VSKEVSAATAWSFLWRAVTIIRMGKPLMSTVGDGDHVLDLVTPQMHCHHCINRGISYNRDGARAELSASASTLIDDSRLATAIGTPPLCRAMWQQYTPSGALAIEPLLPQHTHRKSSVLQHSKEALAA
jgi:hypothetical protein